MARRKTNNSAGSGLDDLSAPSSSSEASAARLSASAKPSTATLSRASSLPPHLSMLRSLTIADYITLVNGISGTSCIFLCILFAESSTILHSVVSSSVEGGKQQRELCWNKGGIVNANGDCIIRDQRLIFGAFILEAIALAADIFDGFVARALRSSSDLGADLDSLSDAISFGVAPVVLGFTLGLRSIGDVLCLLFFVSCGVARLARFNSTRTELATGSSSVKYFEGTPIPMSLLLVLLLFAAYSAQRIGQDFLLGSIRWNGATVFHYFSLLYVALGSLMVSKRLRIRKP